MRLISELWIFRLFCSNNIQCSWIITLSSDNLLACSASDITLLHHSTVTTLFTTNIFLGFTVWKSIKFEISFLVIKWKCILTTCLSACIPNSHKESIAVNGFFWQEFLEYKYAVSLNMIILTSSFSRLQVYSLKNFYTGYFGQQTDYLANFLYAGILRRQPT